MSLNTLTLSGNLGADAELRCTKGGSAVLTFSLAVNERVPKGDGTWGDRTNWIDCTMFGKRAESLAPYLRKGNKVSIVGHLHQSVWQHEGQNRRRLEVRVDEIELMSVRRDQQTDLVAVDELSDAERGAACFGSTGAQ